MAFGQVYDELTKNKTLFGVLLSESKTKPIIFVKLYLWQERT
jgi:hypothetical protein